MILPADPDELVALGAFAGVQIVVLCFSVIIANAYRERSLLIHGASITLALLTVQLIVGGSTLHAQAALFLLLAVDGLHLRELVSHAGALRNLRRLLIVTCLIALPFLAAVGWLTGTLILLPVAVGWATVVTLIMLRAWPQSQPWATWLVAGQLALAIGAIWLGWRWIDGNLESVIPLAGMLSLWAAVTYLSSVWRSRISSETRVRVDARSMTDPLTGLLMPLLFYDRVEAVRNLMIRYGHPSVLLLIHVENIAKLANEFGPEAGESVLPEAADRIRKILRDGDVAARLSHSRIAVLVEGMSPAEAAANVASRVLVAGMKDPLPLALTEFLHFRIVLTAVPVSDLPPKALLQRMSDMLDEQLRAPSERRIVTLTGEDLLG